MSRTLVFRIMRVGLLLLLALAAAPGGPVFAATISVTTANDTIADDGQCSLREAIIAANTNAASSDSTGTPCPAGEDAITDTITLADGATYNLTIDTAGEDVSASGDLDIVNNSAATDMILTAGGGTATIRQQVPDRVLQIIGAGVAIDGLTLTGGTEFDGGGIYNGGGTVTLTNSTISSNTATGNNGGGIFSSAGRVTLTNSAISSNTATTGGGGIFNGAGTVTLTNSAISSNTTTSGGGGGIFNHDGMLFVRDGSTISSNSASEFGGGIFNFGTLAMDDSTISSNMATAAAEFSISKY